MSAFSYLQPNLMTTEELRNHLISRFPNQNVTELRREELLRLYLMYAMPKSRRATPNQDVDMKPANETITKTQNEHKRPRHQPTIVPTVETVTNACKKIRLINTDRTNSNNKRHCELPLMETDNDKTCSSTQSKRKKITWP